MKQEVKLTHVYLMPGMAADSAIFEKLSLPEERFKVHLLEWEIPELNESLEKYSERMTKHILHENIALIGVSFGGVIVQEMAKHLDLYRLIIISSVKCTKELPARMRFASRTGLFKMIPTSLATYVDHFEKFAFGDFLKKRARLYKQYISITDKQYLDWAIKNMVNWKCEKPDEKVIHIHGDRDEVFPIKNIEKAIVVKGGTHIMIINRFRWFNENLPELIITGKMKNKKENKKNNKEL
ncbi:alpha/beta hydrolase [Gramella sp. MAR_2010_147]|uniref:alpha/beta hydrolase n=1 Tax=Gramella sp. MAR_2010_147 TaxID=1250205 RepID=UPI00087B2751|nr:alpha/beta hydrolase [Gramella sp. MAR_2010_147]SDR86298.1 Pimeloyl-ACP methyl ester carboxylesterase [Gramella sp. MAR_2010_147]